MPDFTQLNVHYLPQFVAEHELAGSTVVVVDLLRASTTICHALAARARDVVPFVEIADTAKEAARYDRAEIVLGGERGGQPIEGFDLGNSPAEYTADIVFDRRILFTTTNGTRALEHARLAKRAVVGALVNLSAVVESITGAERIDILCAGTGGHVTREDILAAGAMVHRLLENSLLKDGDALETNDSAQRARGEWEELLAGARASGREIPEQVVMELRETQGGKNLLEIGMDEDLVVCSQIDALSVVPELDIPAWRLHLP